jgi:ribonuclease R
MRASRRPLRGYGFLRVEGRKDDLYLSSEQMKTCIHGDQVLAQPLGATVVRDDETDASVGKVAANNLAGFRHQDADDARFAWPLLYRRWRRFRRPGRQSPQLRYPDPAGRDYGRHIDSHAGTHVVAQHFDDFPHGFGAAGRALGQLDVVVVELTQRPTRRTKAVGKIVEVLGDNMGTGMA